MGDKPKKPKIPKAAPQDLKDFIACKVAKVELKPGTIEWLPIPISPEAKFKPGKAAGEIDIELKLPLKDDPITVTAKVNAEGKLELDPTNLPFGKDGATDWVKELNDWFESRKRKLGQPEIKDGNLVLVKQKLDAAGKQGAFLPNVPWKEKAAGGALVALATVAGVAMMPSDSTETISLPVASPEVSTSVPLDATTTPVETDTTTTPTSVPAVVVPEPVLYDGCIRLVHGNGISFITVFFTTEGEFAGPWEMRWGTTPSGPLTGAGAVTDGLGEIETQINQFGEYAEPEITFRDGVANIETIMDLFPVVVGPSEVSCDPSTLTPAPVLTVTTAPAQEEADDVSSTTVVVPPPNDDGPEQQFETVVQNTDAGPPWSLLLIPGTLLFVGGGLSYDNVRREDQAVDRA